MFFLSSRVGFIFGLYFLTSTLLFTEAKAVEEELSQDQSFVEPPLARYNRHFEKHYNFGFVVNNSTYNIYRSAALGKRGLNKLKGYLESQDLPYPKTIIYMNSEGYAFPFYFAMEEFKASMDPEFKPFTFIHSFGSDRTYVDGVNPYFPKTDIDKPRNLGLEAREYFPLLDNGVDGGIDAVTRVLSFVLDPKNQPVLFHCFGGEHRTGMIGLAIRYMQGGNWVNGPTIHHRGLDLNPAKQEYLEHNPVLFRKGNMDFIDKFQKDPIFLKFKSQYQSMLNSK